MVTLSSPGLTPANAELCDQLASVKARVVANWARAEELQEWTKRVLTETQAARQAIVEARRERRSSSAGRDLTQRSEYARLLARLESMPVIEQAKGIIMAQSHCGDAQAFDLLRRASQRSNVPVRELAAQIVAKTVQVSPKPVKRLSGLDIQISPLGESGVLPSVAGEGFAVGDGC
jgi:ANTAR domain